MIREATPDDLHVLVMLGEQMHAESPRFSRLRYSREVFAATAARLIESPDGFAWVVPDAGGRVVGGLLALACQHWCSTDWVATDIGLFMLPEHRGHGAVRALVRQYRAWAREKGVPPGMAHLGVSTGIETEKTARLLELLGMTRCGVILEG